MEAPALPSLLSNDPARRRPKDALPLCAFAFDRDTRTIYGAFMVTECAYSAAIDRCAWKVGRWAPLLEPVVLGRDDLKWSSTVVHLQKHVEADIRMRLVGGGGALLRDCFLEFAAHRWYAWPLGPEQRAVLTADGPATLLTSRRLADACKVKPTDSRSVLLQEPPG